MKKKWFWNDPCCSYKELTDVLAFAPNIIHKKTWYCCPFEKESKTEICQALTSCLFPLLGKIGHQFFCNDEEELAGTITLCWETWRNVVLLLNLTLMFADLWGNNYSGSFKTAFLQFISFVKHVTNQTSFTYFYAHGSPFPSTCSSPSVLRTSLDGTIIH